MPEIIRLGDPTSHGGTVLEGSQSDICMGKPIALLGHKVFCPKCRGTFPIVEGVLTTSFYGKGVAVAGMKTACGATLIATQFTDTVEWSSGAGSGAGEVGVTSDKAAKSATTGAGVYGAAQLSGKHNGNTDPYDEQPHLLAETIEGVPYLIELKDGRRFPGRAARDGLLPRIETNGQEEYTVYWADEALARMNGEG